MSGGYKERLSEEREEMNPPFKIMVWVMGQRVMQIFGRANKANPQGWAPPFNQAAPQVPFKERLEERRHQLHQDIPLKAGLSFENLGELTPDQGPPKQTQLQQKR